MQTFDLTGKTALVTGGGRGIGSGISEALVEAGAAVVITDIEEEGPNRVARKLSERGGRVLPLQLDITEEMNFQSAIEKGHKEFGKIDILVNNAGIVEIEDALKISMKKWDKIFNVNVRALFRSSQLFAHYLIQQKTGGKIINIASNAGKISYPGQTHYSASKAAVINITQNLAKEFAKYYINVNAICPGAVDTEMLRQCMVQIVEESGGKITIEDLENQWAPPQLGRLIKPIEVGRVVVFLSSEASEIIRGQSINVDAGVTSW